MGCTSSGTSLQERGGVGVGYGLGAVGRASGEGVTGRDGWGDGKVDGGRSWGPVSGSLPGQAQGLK